MGESNRTQTTRPAAPRPRRAATKPSDGSAPAPRPVRTFSTSASAVASVVGSDTAVQSESDRILELAKLAGKKTAGAALYGRKPKLRFIKHPH